MYDTNPEFKTAFDKLSPTEQATFRQKSPGLFTTTTSAPAPVTTVVPPRTPGLLETAQNEAALAASSRATAQREADRYAAGQRNARIDAINRTFAPRISRENEEGQARLSRVAALNVRSGVVGSGVDTTRTGEQKGQNEKAVQALEDQKAIAINEAFGWADELARQRAEDTFSAAKEGAEANVKRYQEQITTAKEALKVFGAQDVTAEKLKVADPKTYATLRDVSGMSDAQMDAYLKANAPEGTYKWDAAQISGSTMYVPKIVNGKVTMEKVDLGFTPGKEYKTSVKTDDGVMVIYGDGTYDLIGSGGGAPSWESYLAAAERAAKMNFSNESTSQLREQYDREFVLADTSDFTSSEKKRLEQAGLLSSTRQEQLDFLYGDDTGGIDFGSVE